MNLRRSAQAAALAGLSVIFLVPSGGAVINGCGELRPLAAKVQAQNEFVQEASFRHSDPNWCSHAKAILQDVTTMVQIIKADATRVRMRVLSATPTSVNL
jgi:hypothetical protein